MANIYDGVKSTLYPSPLFEASPAARQFLELDAMPPLANITLSQAGGVQTACGSGSQSPQPPVPSTPVQYWS